MMPTPGETLYLYAERRTVKAGNLAVDPRLVVHLESGEDVVIVRRHPQSAMTWRLADHDASQRRWTA